MSAPALSMSAVSSTTAGGLPGPRRSRACRWLIAALTTPGPAGHDQQADARMRHQLLADSMVGSSMPVTTLGGPPAPTIARLIEGDGRHAAAWSTRGAALKTTVLPAAIMPIALQMIVEAGLVTGVMAPMTPNGADSVSVIPWSPVTASIKLLQARRLLDDQAVL